LKESKISLNNCPADSVVMEYRGERLISEAKQNNYHGTPGI